jgi:hypothetical protein
MAKNKRKHLLRYCVPIICNNRNGNVLKEKKAKERWTGGKRKTDGERIGEGERERERGPKSARPPRTAEYKSSTRSLINESSRTVLMTRPHIRVSGFAFA